MKGTVMTREEMLADIKSGRRKKLILDTDTYNEIDDQFALTWCYLADNIDLIAVNAAPFNNPNRCSGYEDGMLKSLDEIKKVLSLIDPNYTTPVFEGSRTTITELGGKPVDSPAARNIIKTVKESDEPVYVAGIGAITNVVSALLLDPSIKDNMCVIWQGTNEFRNTANPCDFNLAQDYMAGQHLLNIDVPLLISPSWCVTHVIEGKYEDFCILKGHNDICDYLFSLIDWSYNLYNQAEDWTHVVWDFGPPAILSCPECATIETIPAPVFADGSYYAQDSTRRKILYLRAIDPKIVFDNAWKAFFSIDK